MKRSWMLLVLAGLVLIAVSCQKTTTTATTTPAALTADAKAGFVIRAGEGIWDIQDGVAKWADSLLLGEKLALTGQTNKAAPAGGQQRDYVEVKRDSGKTGWARTDYVISNCTLGVVGNEEAVLYTEPKNTAATGTSIPKLTIIAIHAEGATAPYVKVTWFNPTSLVLSKGVYIRGDVVSQKPDDVQSIILLQLAQASTNPKQQQALLASAQKDYPGSAFITQIEDALAGLAPVATMAPATEKFFATLVSTDDKVNVRDTPDETAGTVVTQLTKGQKVEVEEQTKDSFTVNGQSAPWYKIKDPAGWVFGALLAPEE
jgi:uncharacterized protein YgiM (DUF1202 family)